MGNGPLVGLVGYGPSVGLVGRGPSVGLGGRGLSVSLVGYGLASVLSLALTPVSVCEVGVISIGRPVVGGIVVRYESTVVGPCEEARVVVPPLDKVWTSDFSVVVARVPNELESSLAGVVEGGFVTEKEGQMQPHFNGHFPMSLNLQPSGQS